MFVTCLQAVLLMACTAGAQIPRPDHPHVSKGACPFECCSYGEWKVIKETHLRAQPDDDSPVIATIPAGGQVNVPTGEVHVLPGRAAITGQPHRSARRLDSAEPLKPTPSQELSRLFRPTPKNRFRDSTRLNLEVNRRNRYSELIRRVCCRRSRSAQFN